MIRQIVFYIEFFESAREPTSTDVIQFNWDGKSPVMDSAFPALKSYMDNRYPNEEYGIKDWEWVDKR
jgi:hypothetical protein